MITEPKLKDCFLSAEKDEKKGRKHKGLLISEKDSRKAEEYLQKARRNLEICEIYKERRLDYKIPEEWFYTMYYCALAILAKFGVESRSQRCTALLLRYVKNKGMIDFDEEFIDRITVYKDKEEVSDVDERENARYGSSVQSKDIIERYDFMAEVCKKCISQCEEIIFSEGPFELPEELIR